MKTYKHTYVRAVGDAPDVRARLSSPLRIIWHMILRRKILMISTFVLIFFLPIALRVGDPPGRRPTFRIQFFLLSTHYVYLLKSLKDGKYYIGQTDNIEKRLQQHNNGQVQSTKSRRPLLLIGYENYNSRDEARWAEYQYKHHSDKKKVLIEKFHKQA